MTSAEESEATGDGRQERWREHNEARRERIIRSAVAIIEETGSDDVHVHQIAQRAGLSRSVVYRHFDDRADLDRAVQEAIVEDISSRLIPATRLEGTGPEIVRRIVGTYVEWAVAHPELHRAADHESGPLEQGLERIATQVATVIATAVLALGAEPDEESAAALDPLVYGLVGAVFGSVRRWLHRPDRVLSAERLTHLVSGSVWFVIEGHARTLGIDIDAERRLDELALLVTRPR